MTTPAVIHYQNKIGPHGIVMIRETSTGIEIHVAGRMRYAATNADAAKAAANLAAHRRARQTGGSTSAQANQTTPDSAARAKAAAWREKVNKGGA